MRGDARLLPVVAGIWLAQALVLRMVHTGGLLRAGVLTAGCGLMMLGTGASVWLLVRGRPRRGPGQAAGRPGTRWLHVSAAVGGSVIVGALLGLLRAGPLQDPVLADLASAHSVVTADVVLRAYPRVQQARPGPPPTVQLDARLARTISQGESRRWDLPVRIYGTMSPDTRALWGQVRIGDRIRARVAVRAPPGGKPWAAVLVLRGRPELTARGPWWNAMAARVRASMDEAVQSLPPDQAGLVAGLAVGDDSRLPTSLRDAMRTVGLSHLTAVSGSNIALVTGAVLFAAVGLRLRRRVAVTLAATALAGFVLVVGLQPSVLRAAVMGALLLVALAGGGKRDGFAALFFTCLVLLLVDPWLSLAAGFALSVLATAGLLTWASWHRNRAGDPGPGVRGAGGRNRLVRRAGRLIAEGAGVAFAAQLATFPVLAAMGSGLALMAVPANLLALPAVALTTVLGLAASMAGLLAPDAGAGLAWLASLAARWIAAVARTAASVPGGVRAWPAGLGGAVLALAVSVTAVAVVVVVRRRLRTLPGRGYLAFATCLLVGALAFGRPLMQAGAWPPAGWLAVMCDVGQGDAAVIRTGAGHGVMIDTGPEPELADRCLDGLGIKTVDVLVLTHFHADHVDGLAGVLRGRQVGLIEVSPLADPAENAAEVTRLAAVARVPVQVAVPDEQRALGPVSWRILWPRWIVREGSAPNNASVTLRACTGSVCVLFAGDLEPDAQRDLMATDPGEHVDVVKVPHHGSSHQDPRLIAWSGAHLAVISVGADNSYGHPAPGTVRAWEQAGSVVTRTDQNGDVAVVADSGHAALIPRRTPSR